MKKFYFIFITTFLLFQVENALDTYTVLAGEIQKTDTTKTKANPKTKITDTRLNKPDFLKNGIKIKITPFKPSVIKSTTSTTAPSSKNNTAFEDDDKILSNVKVYPNPVEDEINLSYRVNKDSNVTIKIMDALGNEITTLLSQKLIAGEQSNTFNLSSRLNSGFYFIRLMVGTEIVVKRISVL